MPKLNYEFPKQVKFYEPENDYWIGGIAYGEYIICGECGGLVKISDVYEMAPHIEQPIQEYSSWGDISEAIIEE